MERARSLLGITLLFLFASTFLTSCMDCIEGEGPVSAESRSLDYFTDVAVNVSADVVITQGDESQIKIMAQENLLDIIKTKVRGNELVINSSQCMRTSDGIKIELIVPDLSAVMLNGSGSISTRSVFNADNFEVSINGSGEVAVDVHADDITALINGSGEIIVNGSTKELEVVINGSGDFRGLGIVTEDAEVIIRGSGDVYINAQNSLKAEILGTGDIIYAGNPSINSSVKGSGNILKKD